MISAEIYGAWKVLVLFSTKNIFCSIKFKPVIKNVKYEQIGLPYFFNIFKFLQENKLSQT